MVLFNEHYELPLRSLADRLGSSITGVHRRKGALKEKYSSLAKEPAQLTMRAFASQDANATEQHIGAFLESRGAARYGEYGLKYALPVPLDGSRCLIRAFIDHRVGQLRHSEQSHWLVASCRLRPFYSMDSECSWALSYARPGEILSDADQSLLAGFMWFVSFGLSRHLPWSWPWGGTPKRPDLEFWEPFRRSDWQPERYWAELPADPSVRARLAKLLRFESTERFEEAVAPLTSEMQSMILGG